MYTTVHDYEGLAWHQVCKMCPGEVRQDLRMRELWEDMRQEVAIAAWIAASRNLDTRETARFIQREIYAALINMGYRRPKGCPCFLWHPYDIPDRWPYEPDDGPDIDLEALRDDLQAAITQAYGEPTWAMVWRWATSSHSRHVPTRIAKIVHHAVNL